MLTKQERAEIATRFISYDGGTLYFAELFECLFNREIPGSTTTKEDTEAVIDRLIDLCDTSNMVELPRDKDGEVIRVGDVVYDEDNNKHRVKGYSYGKGNWKIIISLGSNGYLTNALPNKLTHKNPVTIASLVEQIRYVINSEEYVYPKSYIKLLNIANQLERLGDSDD